MTKKRLSKEKETRLLEVSLIPVFAVPLIVLFYFLYLDTVGVDISVLDFFNSMLIVLPISFIVCLTFHELLLKMYGGQFKFKRLLFRLLLATSYFMLCEGAYLCLSTLFPWATVYYQFFFGGLIATGIYVIIILKSRHHFPKFDKD